MDVVIRSAWPQDLPAVARIYAHYVGSSVSTFHESAPTISDWHTTFWQVAERGLPFLVAEIEGEIVGYAYCSPWRSRPAYRYTVEDSVYVMPQVAGRGVGRQLLDELLQHCRQCGVRQVIAVIVDTPDPASAALHKRCGFARAGQLSQVGFKQGQWLNTVLMQRSLTD